MPVSNLAAIQRVYEAFETGDFATLFELCDPDVTVTQDPALPWGGEYHGHDGVATFGLALSGAIQSAVTIESLFEAGDHVIQSGRTRGTAHATGATFDIPETHVWTLRDGKIVAAEFYIETAAMLVALGSPR
jgi:ketosteroid isomerase-like protein